MLKLFCNFFFNEKDHVLKINSTFCRFACRSEIIAVFMNAPRNLNDFECVAQTAKSAVITSTPYRFVVRTPPSSMNLSILLTRWVGSRAEYKSEFTVAVGSSQEKPCAFSSQFRWVGHVTGWDPLKANLTGWIALGIEGTPVALFKQPREWENKQDLSAPSRFS